MIKLQMIPSSLNKRHPLVFAVMNVTPDSFSDGGLHLKKKTVTETLKTWKGFQSLVPDIGAESTAPMNRSISHEHEWERLENFFELHLPELLTFSSLSFDTYKTETILKILDLLNEHSYQGAIYWNDVSGQYDKDVEALLANQKNLFWILCHTLVPSRALSCEHKKYAAELKPDNILILITEWFQMKIQKISPQRRSQVILDPCFGFSKDEATNLELCKDLPLLIKAVPEEFCWLIGISKKSFLQAQVVKRGVARDHSDFWREVEFEHLTWLTQWVNQPFFNRLSFRIHDPLLMRDALSASSTTFHF